jgi:ParB-like chromosome segregation protein Spo0J
MTQEMVDIYLIDANPWQPRGTETGEHIANLAVSIADDGLMQIPSARKVGERYQLAFGHSRLAAFKMLASMQTGVFDAGDPESPLGRALHAAKIALENLTDFEQMPLNIMDIDDETMFRFAVSENVQRKDLNAIETAQAMRRYKDEFNRTSADVGALFGVNESTVRGTLRLLDLPDEARAMLGRGEISQGAARTLLSTRNIWSAEKITLAAKRIAAQAGVSTPDAVIRGLMGHNYDQSNPIVEMWADGDGSNGKPRAGFSHNKTDYWLLDMRNFPNDLLPKLTLSEIPDALGKEQDTQLLRYLAHSDSPLELSMKLGALDDEAARQMAAVIDILRDPPSACLLCPLYAKVNGIHYCGLKACHKRKESAWHKDKLMQASKALSIRLYEEKDGAYLLLDGYTSHKKLFEERHADLRLIDKHAVRGYHYQRFEGVDDDYFFVVMVGKTLLEAKEVKRQERAAEKAGNSVVHGRFEMEQDCKEKLTWAAADEFAGLLRTWNLAAINALMSASYGWYCAAPKWEEKQVEGAADDIRADFLRRKVALNMIKRMPVVCKNEWGISLVQLAERLEAAALELGFDLPNSIMGLARQFDFDIEATYPKAPVSVETVQEVQ